MLSDSELAKILLQCNQDAAHFASLPKGVQTEVRQYCNEIIKYSGTTYQLPGGKVFTDSTLLKPAKSLVKSIKRLSDNIEKRQRKEL